MDVYGPGLNAANPDVEWVLRAAVIRFAPGTDAGGGAFTVGGPYIHTNAQHVPVGVKEVRVEPDGDLFIDVDGGPVSFIAALADETLTVRGISFGPSGTAASSTLRCRKQGVGVLNLATQAGWDAVSGDLSNIWCFWATCVYPGVGQPSKADRALTQVTALAGVVDEQAALIASQGAALSDALSAVAALTLRVDELDGGGS